VNRAAPQRRGPLTRLKGKEAKTMPYTRLAAPGHDAQIGGASVRLASGGTRIGTRLTIVLLAAALLAGCGLQLAPYNGRLSCQGVGGTYTSDGRCLAGNA
jgi:hypothetical protein